MHLTELRPHAPSTELAEKLHWQLFRIMSTMRRHEYDRTASGTLTLTQCSLLHLLSERGRMCMTDLATAEKVAPPTMSRAVRRLVELGMVRRFRDFDDQRTVWVEITPSGLQSRHDAVTEMYEVIGSALSPTEIDALHAALGPLESLATIVTSMPSPAGSELVY